MDATAAGHAGLEKYRNRIICQDCLLGMAELPDALCQASGHAITASD